MGMKSVKWRIVGALVVPFVVASLFLVIAENLRAIWPMAFGEIQQLGWVVGAISGFLFIPRLSWTKAIVVAVVYFAAMLGALFYFSLWFVFFFFGDAL